MIFFPLFLFPVLWYNWTGGGNESIGVQTTLIYLLPLFLLCLLPRHKGVTVFLFSLLMIGTLAETSMLLLMKGFLTSGAILATMLSNTEEAGAVAVNGLHALKILIPLVILYIVAVVMYAKSTPVKSKYIGIVFLFTLLFAGGFYWKRTSHIVDKPLWHQNTVLHRPPYNFYVQLYRASTQLIRQHRIPAYIAQLADFEFGAYRVEKHTNQRETYVFVIGESMRYDHLSLNKSYKRGTTPMLETMDRVVSFSDYYSTACLTMYAVPLLITRAEPETFDLHYKERSIVAPFQECGFTTCAVIRENQFLSVNDFLIGGIDSLIIIPHDDDLIEVIDNLSATYPKLFVITEIWGQHHPYDNYPHKFEWYTPSSNTDPVKYTNADYLINAYDNSILYTDSVLATLIQTLDKKDIVSAVVYVSDHGESISDERVGHGFEHIPTPHDFYKCEFHVPFLVWYSDNYVALYPEKIHNLYTNQESALNANSMFYSLCAMADIQLPPPYWKAELNVFDSCLEVSPRTILLTDGEYVMDVDK